MAGAKSPIKPLVKMATPDFKITADKTQLAKDKHYYIKVGTPSVSHLSLTGCQGRWKKEPNFIYLPTFRLAGSNEAVRAVLKQNAYSEADINNAIKHAYSATNQGGDFQKEMEACQAFRSTKPKVAKNPVTAESLKLLLKGELKLVPRNTITQPSRVTTNSKVEPIASQLANLAEDKYLDVSKMKANGSNITKRPLAVLNKRTKRVAIDSVRIISSNEENLVAALRLLGKTDAEVEADCQNWRENSQRIKTQLAERKSPVTKRVKSPIPVPPTVPVAQPAVVKRATLKFPKAK